MLDGLDDIGWAALRHNYGTAENIPGLLRAAARGEGAANANDSLDNLLLHQGGWVCSAATAALPFLVELAETPGSGDRDANVELIARLACEAAEAEPEYVDDGWHEAWAGVFPRVLRLLDDPARENRSYVAWAVGASRFQADAAVAALKDRFEREPDTGVRGDIIEAVAELGEDGWVDGLRDHPDPSVSIPALLLAKTREGATVGADRLAGILTTLAETSDWDLYAPVHSGRTSALTASDKAAVAEALIGHPETRRRTAALRLANVLLAEDTELEDRLVPLLASRLDDPDTRFKALEVLAALGRPAAPYAGRFAGFLGDETPSGRRDQSTVADAALWALARLGDERCVPALAGQVASVGRHVRGHDSTIHIWSLPSLGEVLEQLPDALVPAMLPAVRAQLAGGEHSARLDYLNTVVVWGALAAEARPEIEALVDTPADYLARQALDAIAARRPEAPDPAELTASEPWTRTRAAHRLWRATGEVDRPAGVLVDVVGAALDRPRAEPVGRAAIAHLAEMGAAEARPVARRVLDEKRRLHYFGGWRVFTEDDAWRSAARRILTAAV